MGTPTPRTDPRIIREVLTYADTHGAYVTAKHFNTDPSNVYRWLRHRATKGPSWPTNKDINDWDGRAVIRDRNKRRWRNAQHRQHFNTGPALIDATGTVRRLRALVALGHSQVRIGAKLCVTGARVSQLCRGRSKLVFRETAAKVIDLYNEWWDVVPTDRGANAARAYARSQAWGSPLAWDDETIDDPEARPHGVAGVGRGRRAAA